MVFEGFNSVTSPQAEITEKFRHMHPTLSQLSKIPADRAGYKTITNIGSAMTGDLLKQIVKQQIKQVDGIKDEEIREAWTEFQARATSNAQPVRVIESDEQRKKRIKAIANDNEHYNAAGARWPVFSQTRMNHQQLGRLMHGLTGDEKMIAFKRVRDRVLDVRIAKAIDVLRDMDPARLDNKKVDKYGFKEISDKDRKILYNKYGFTHDSDDNEDDKSHVAKSALPTNRQPNK